jgi:hypothetical protein
MYESVIDGGVTMHLEATFEIAGWDEQPYVEWEGGKLTRASVSTRYAGGIEGGSVLEYLMSYAADGSVTYVAMERVNGTAGGRSGGLVLRHIGRFSDGAAKSELTVVGGSGDFDGAAGAGTMVADPGGRVTIDLS